MKSNGQVQALQTPAVQQPKQIAIPRCDIHETDAAIHLTAEMPGVDPTSVEVTLERNVVSIQGRSNVIAPEGYRLLWREFEVVDYQRSFELGDSTDESTVRASMHDGVLRIEVPKRVPVQRKIPVTAG